MTMENREARAAAKTQRELLEEIRAKTHRQLDSSKDKLDMTPLNN